MESIYDPIRCKFVPATPEERVRQRLIRKMIGELGFPKGLIAVEKDIINPNRRIDILSYAPGKEGLFPLLLIECKAGGLKPQAKSQVFGYNDSVAAPFVALANDVEIEMFWQEEGRIASVPFLPRYAELVEQVCRI